MTTDPPPPLVDQQDVLEKLRVAPGGLSVAALAHQTGRLQSRIQSVLQWLKSQGKVTDRLTRGGKAVAIWEVVR